MPAARTDGTQKRGVRLPMEKERAAMRFKKSRYGEVSATLEIRTVLSITLKMWTNSDEFKGRAWNSAFCYNLENLALTLDDVPGPFVRSEQFYTEKWRWIVQAAAPHARMEDRAHRCGPGRGLLLSPRLKSMGCSIRRCCSMLSGGTTNAQPWCGCLHCRERE
jgi:hypothetical protein